MPARVSEPTRQDIEQAALAAEKSSGMGTPGRPFDRRSPFFIGMAAAGVAVTYGVAELVIRARVWHAAGAYQLRESVFVVIGCLRLPGQLAALPPSDNDAVGCPQRASLPAGRPGKLR